MFKDLGLTQEGGQKAVDHYTKLAQKIADAPFEAYNAMRDGWRKEVFSDKALGNGKDGLNSEAASTMAKAIDSLGAEADGFRKALATTGVGDNPAFLRGFLNLAKRFAEGKPATGSAPSSKGQTGPGKANGVGAAAMYPDLPSSAG